MGWLLWLLACGGSDPAPPPTDPSEPPATTASALPPHARVETHQALVDDLAAERSASDGGGRLTRVEGPSEVVAGTAHRWVLRYEAGPLGIAEGGALYFQTPAFWEWSPAQLRSPEAPGYTTVRTDAGVGLDAERVDRGLVRVTVGSGGLAAGQAITLVYGDAAGPARADGYAEGGAELWVAVDGDGDGVRQLVDEPVRIDVDPGAAARLWLTLPSTSEPGSPVALTVAAVDRRGNGPAALSGTVALEGSASLGLPRSVPLVDGVARVELIPEGPGVFAVRAAVGGIEGQSNPVLVATGAQPVLWGDLQIHTGLSDGTGQPEAVWRYARDVAGLDVASLTDHDHWGMRFLDQHPALWARSVAAAEAVHEPGRFVAIPGSEWTNWLYGHRHLLWFEPDPPLVSCMDPDTDDPDELWAALEGRKVLTVAHHSAGEPVPVDWTFHPPPALEPVTEVVSVHGQSWSADVAGSVRGGVAGNYVVDQLRNGLRLGLMGSTDGHDGHPGLAQLNGPSGGLVALLTADRTRQGVYTALRERRTYATNGSRILVTLDAGGRTMGSSGPATATDFDLRVLAPTPVARVVAFRRDSTELLVSGTGSTALRHTWTEASPKPGDFVVLQVETVGGGMAWTSPVWFDAPG